MKQIGLIPRNRLKNLPPNLRVKHEYCFFLHDQCVQIAKEYEEAKANVTKFKFKNARAAREFEEISRTKNPIEALHKTVHPKVAKKALLNSLTIPMFSDCMHHLYEALRCLEKRKFIVALNLLRKPLKDNLLYLSWMLGDDEGFYNNFMAGNPRELSQKKLGNFRTKIFSNAIDKTGLGKFIDPVLLNEVIYDRKCTQGLEELFQHAVHLITVQNIELRTLPQNFNFIFADAMEDDIYYQVYEWLPYILLFLSHVVAGLFNKMKKMEKDISDIFYIRTVHGFMLTEDKHCQATQEVLEKTLSNEFACYNCKSQLNFTHYNATKIILTESFRCTACKHINQFPFSWIISDYL